MLALSVLPKPPVPVGARPKPPGVKGEPGTVLPGNVPGVVVLPPPPLAGVPGGGKVVGVPPVGVPPVGGVGVPPVGGVVDGVVPLHERMEAKHEKMQNRNFTRLK